MTQKASRPFWLDGGYDRDAVDACSAAPGHDWWTFRLGDVLVDGACRDPDERLTVCRKCAVPRCGHTADDPRCALPRHHEGDHLPVRERAAA